jgi:UDP-N-acetylmuramoyl-tripeptide--D-alanyl-D-alanine ligase
MFVKKCLVLFCDKWFTTFALQTVIMVDLDALYAYYKNFPSICTDSRQVTKGCLFFALKGERFDGNKFANQVIADGAAYCVVDDPSLEGQPGMLVVQDVLKSLQELAKMHRRKFQIPIIAIGGSNGKTTTKELVSAVLGSQYPCHFTKGNLNNHIGVPLTLLAMPNNTEVAVIEVGANHIGEIEELCKIAEPTHGLLTNIGKEHLEGFGSLEGVKKAEGELYRYLNRSGGCAFVNGTEKYLGSMSRVNRRKVTYKATENIHESVDNLIIIRPKQYTPVVEVSFLGEQQQEISVKSHLFGRHNFHNIASAIALGIYFKVPGTKIKEAIEGYIPSNNRSQVIVNGSNTILLDAYNANPSSMEVALASLVDMDAPNKIAILGDMLELGEHSEQEHTILIQKALKLPIKLIVLVGPIFGSLKIHNSRILYFNNAVETREWLHTQKMNDSVLLIKGSRGIQLEKVLEK